MGTTQREQARETQNDNDDDEWRDGTTRKTGPRDVVVHVSWVIVCFFYIVSFFLLTFFSVMNSDYYNNTPLRSHPTRRHHERRRTTTMIGGRLETMTAQETYIGVIVCFFFSFIFFYLLLFKATNSTRTKRSVVSFGCQVCCFSLYLYI